MNTPASTASAITDEHPKFFPFHSGADHLPPASLAIVKAIETALLRFELLACNRMHGAVEPSVGFDELRAALHAFIAPPTTQPTGQKPAYWQWRRKGEPWQQERIFESQVYATTDDSEVRELYERAAVEPSQPAAEAIGEMMTLETAPWGRAVLLVVEEMGSGERRVMFAEQSSSVGKPNHWEVTSGWAGWAKLHSAWTPVGWMPIPPAPAAPDCEHEWLVARKEVLLSGEICIKCHALRSGDMKL